MLRKAIFIFFEGCLFALSNLSGSLKGFNAINAIKGVKVAAFKAFKDFFQNPGCNSEEKLFFFK